jgi:hypothetical protein
LSSDGRDQGASTPPDSGRSPISRSWLAAIIPVKIGFGLAPPTPISTRASA